MEKEFPQKTSKTNLTEKSVRSLKGFDKPTDKRTFEQNQLRLI